MDVWHHRWMLHRQGLAQQIEKQENTDFALAKLLMTLAVHYEKLPITVQGLLDDVQSQAKLEWEELT